MRPDTRGTARRVRISAPGHSLHRPSKRRPRWAVRTGKLNQTARRLGLTVIGGSQPYDDLLRRLTAMRVEDNR